MLLAYGQNRWPESADSRLQFSRHISSTKKLLLPTTNAIAWLKSQLWPLSTHKPRHNLAPHLNVYSNTYHHAEPALEYTVTFLSNTTGALMVYNIYIDVVNMLQDYVHINEIYRLYGRAARLHALDTDDSRSLPYSHASDSRHISYAWVSWLWRKNASAVASSQSHSPIPIWRYRYCQALWNDGCMVQRVAWCFSSLITSTLKRLHHFYLTNCFELCWLALLCTKLHCFNLQVTIAMSCEITPMNA